MLSFKEFITEIWQGAFKSKALGKAAEIHKNPSRKDLPSISSYNGSRAIFHGKDVYMWDGEKAFHHETQEHLGLRDKDVMHAVIDHKQKTVQAWSPQNYGSHGWHDHDLDNHPWITRNGYRTEKNW